MTSFRAIRIDKDESGSRAAYVDFDEAELMDGDVDVAVTHSTINYKDGLAITGKSPVVRRFPIIPGVDFAGRVTRSTHKDFAPGDLVIAGGCGLGEAHYGGFAQTARVNGDWLVPLPQGLTSAQAMAIGTAGLTAMFCVLALERHGLTPDRGPVVVTGAAGGVGSIAVALLAGTWMARRRIDGPAGRGGVFAGARRRGHYRPRGTLHSRQATADATFRGGRGHSGFGHAGECPVANQV